IRNLMGEAAFADWGWRIPFLLSIVLLVVSIWIRLKLNESPIFQRMKEEGRTSKRPLSEAFGQWSNAKIAILALLGATAGEAVVWYGGQFYALFFLADHQGRRHDSADPGRGRAGNRHAVLYGLRLAVGKGRAQADHAAGLPPGGRDVRAGVAD